MVIEYSDIFVGVDEKLPAQDWHTPAWHSTTEDDSITVYRDDWRRDNELEACFYSYGQGKDPEQNPVVLEIHLGGVLDSKNEKMEELEERIQEELKPLIGWEVVKEGDLFARKELPSDPLTLRPRLLEELKKLEPIAYRIDQMLGYAEDDQEVEVSSVADGTSE
jgi:hypothetical protein